MLSRNLTTVFAILAGVVGIIGLAVALAIVTTEQYLPQYFLDYLPWAYLSLLMLAFTLVTFVVVWACWLICEDIRRHTGRGMREKQLEEQQQRRELERRRQRLH